MTQERKQLFVVLGMHRSGTSVSTRALEVMGVSLGNNLMPAYAGNNDKGFFEDSDITQLNIELLSFLQEDWHTLKPILPDAVTRLVNAEYLTKSVNLLNAKLAVNTNFAFKDPRVTKLLPFWRLVFKACGIEPSYVLVLRNPASVADSLLKRDGIQREKSYLLWLSHVISMLTSNLDAASKVMLDYDALMLAPEKTLRVVATAFNLHINELELNKYIHDFLDQALMHTHYSLSDLECDPKCPPIVKEVYAGLLEMIKDNASFSFQEHAKQITDWSNEYARLYPTLTWIDNITNEVDSVKKQYTTSSKSMLTSVIQALFNYDASLVKSKFIQEWYLQQNPDVLEAGIEPYEHFIKYGMPEGRLPFPNAEMVIADLVTQSIDGLKVQLANAVEFSEARFKQLHNVETNFQLLSAELEQTKHEHSAREQAYQQQIAHTQKHIDNILAEFDKTYTAQQQEFERVQSSLHEALIARETLTRETSEHVINIQNKHAQQLLKAQQFFQETVSQLSARADQKANELITQERMHNAQLEGSRARFHQQLEECYKELGELRIQSSTQQAESKKLVSLLTSKQAEIDALANQYHALETEKNLQVHSALQELSEIQLSLSWRITYPLRAIAHQLGFKTRQPEIIKANHQVKKPEQINLKVENVPSGSERVVNMANNNKSQNIDTLAKLMALRDEQFIYSAYQTILKRQPDAAGLDYYLARLRSGVSKLEILKQLRHSKEGKQVNAQIRGLDQEIKKYRILKTPIIGPILKMAGIKGADNPEQKLLAIEAALGAMDIEYRKQMYLMQVSLDNIAKQLSRTPNLNASQDNHYAQSTNTTQRTIQYDTNEFDAEWYLSQYPDVLIDGYDPYEHYLKHGLNEGRHPKFDADWYLNEYPDVKKAGLDPLKHYLDHGKLEGRYPLFHEAWYLAQNADVPESGLSPYEHYLKIGKTQGRSPAFSAYANQVNNYLKWLAEFDVVDKSTRIALAKKITGFKQKPLISIVMPVYNPKSEWLEKAIESVRDQIYPHWELCIADDASTDAEIKSVLERYRKMDDRIKVVYREKNGHISEASNSALAMATGEWVALLDHDDAITPHALFWVVDAINQNKDIGLIYSDEDKIDENDLRKDPYFKCDWNEDLFYSHNLITHLGVYRTDIIKKIDGFRTGVEGSQDYDLALRAIEQLNPSQIHHIPRVLYHWRVHSESTAQSADAKPYAMLAGEKAINDHFKRIGKKAKAELLGYGYRVRYEMPKKQPLVSLIIPTRNGVKLLKQCVDSILNKTNYKQFEIIVVDNGSDESDTLAYLNKLKSNKKITVIRDDRPFNYSALNNQAVKIAKGELIGLINNDIEVINPEWLSEMVSHALRPEVGCVGAKLFYANNTVQHAGVILGLGGLAAHSHRGVSSDSPGYFGRANLIQELSAVTAACLLVKKSIYEQLGGLNEKDLAVAYNDVDFCLRVKEAGYKNIYTPYATLYHHESATRGKEDTQEKQVRFDKEKAYMEKRWKSIIKHDPAYSPNLTTASEDFSYAWPSRVNIINKE